MWLFLLSLLICYFYFSSGERRERLVDDPEVVEAANFAIEELRKLSESGIYETLHLDHILYAESEIGTFHFNIFLNVSLSCPYYKSKKNKEEYEIIVMKNLEDGIKSFAINEFPEMEEEKIEIFWIQMVEKHKKERKELFIEWEKELKEKEKQQEKENKKANEQEQEKEQEKENKKANEQEQEKEQEKEYQKLEEKISKEHEIEEEKIIKFHKEKERKFIEQNKEQEKVDKMQNFNLNSKLNEDEEKPNKEEL